MPEALHLVLASPVNALVRKLERFASLGEAERASLDQLVAVCEVLPPGAPIVSTERACDSVLPLLQGLAYRHKDFRDGRRQILAVLMPGDICAGDDEAFGRVDCGIRSLTPVKVARISAERFRDLIARHPLIAIALRRASLIDRAILQAWITNLGQRRAHERMAHLMCELAQRMTDCGLACAHGDFELPVTQQELGSALGLTGVHVNRILQRLRAERLVEFRSGLFRVHDLARLRQIADFDPAYLAA